MAASSSSGPAVPFGGASGSGAGSGTQGTSVASQIVSTELEDVPDFGDVRLEFDPASRRKCLVHLVTGEVFPLPTGSWELVDVDGFAGIFDNESPDQEVESMWVSEQLAMRIAVEAGCPE
eukprot:4740483-Pyramimonas_sp.AAC.1